jgi:hypothetical protein
MRNNSGKIERNLKMDKKFKIHVVVIGLFVLKSLRVTHLLQIR